MGWHQLWWILQCIVTLERPFQYPGLSCGWGTVSQTTQCKEVKPWQNRNNVAEWMDHFRKATVWKTEIETRPFGKELRTATPQRHQTGIGPLWEGPPLKGSYKAIGRCPNCWRRLKVKNVPNGPFEVEWPVSGRLAHLGQTGRLRDVIMTS